MTKKPLTASSILKRYASASAKAAKQAADALRVELRSEDLSNIVRARVLDGAPHVFTSEPTKYQTLQQHLATELSVATDAIRVVGSARTGFSMSPDSFGRQFLPNSDIDVVVVSDTLFDATWRLLLDWRYPWHLRKWSKVDHDWGIRILEELVCGWCNPKYIEPPTLTSRAQVTPLRDFSWRWVNAFQSAGGLHPELSTHNLEGRLYRTWDHAIKYHVSGFKLILDQERRGAERTT